MKRRRRNKENVGGKVRKGKRKREGSEIRTDKREIE